MPITGGCACGNVRYSIDADAPLDVRSCWCRHCQYLAAGNATVNMVCATATVAITGTMVDHVSTADSGNIMHRWFCPTCGTQILSEAEARPHLKILRAGTLDDPVHGRPTMTVWTDATPPWAMIDPDLPAYPRGQP